jgi:uncharacterized protein with GYD domain
MINMVPALLPSLGRGVVMVDILLKNLADNTSLLRQRVAGDYQKGGWRHGDQHCFNENDRSGDQGRQERTQRIEAAIKAVEAMGGKMTGFYFTMGEYDYIAITEGLSDEAGASYLLKLGSAGNVRTKTLKAFTRQEFAEMVKKLS